MSDIQPNDDGTCSLGGCDACQYVIPGGTYDSDSCVCSLVWNRFVFCFEICPVAHGRLRARVEELKSWHQEQGETLAGVALDYAQMKIERDRAKQCLRAVMKLAIECEAKEDGPYPEDVIEAARYVRCKCGGSGKLKFTNVENADDEYYEPCPCVANGTTGWREANDG